MGFVDSMKDFFSKGADGYDDYEDYEEYEDYEDEETVEERPLFSRFYTPKRDNVVNFEEPQRRSARDAAMEITIVKIRKFEEAESVAEILKAGGPVIFDVLEMENSDAAKRVVDFISGVVCGIGGNDRRVSGGIFMATPPCMTIKIEENLRGGRGKWNMTTN